MSLKIRLARAGTKKRPFYHIVIADSRSPRDGRFIESLGSWNPLLPKDGERVKVDADRVKHWLSHGAQPTDRVLRFLDEAGLAKREARSNPKKAEPGKKAQERAALLKKAQDDAAAAVAAAAAAPPRPPTAAPFSVCEQAPSAVANTRIVIAFFIMLPLSCGSPSSPPWH